MSSPSDDDEPEPPSPTYVDRFNHRLATLLIDPRTFAEAFREAESTTPSYGRSTDPTRANDGSGCPNPVKLYWRTPVLLPRAERSQRHYIIPIFLDVTFDYVGPASPFYVGSPHGPPLKGRRVDATFGIMLHHATDNRRGDDHRESLVYIRDKAIRSDIFGGLAGDDIDPEPEELAEAVAEALRGKVVVVERKEYGYGNEMSKDEAEADEDPHERPLDDASLNTLKESGASVALRETGKEHVDVALSHPSLFGQRRGHGQFRISHDSTTVSFHDDYIVPCCYAATDAREKIEGRDSVVAETVMNNWYNEDKLKEYLKAATPEEDDTAKNVRTKLADHCFKYWWFGDEGKQSSAKRRKR